MFQEYFAYVLEEIKAIGMRIAYALPGFLTALVVVLVTLLLAKLVKNLLTKLLRAIGINVFSRKVGLDDLLKPTELAAGVSELIGIVVYWLLLFLGFTYALRLAGFTSAEMLLDRIILSMPRIFISIVILVIGLNIAGFLGSLAEKTALAARISYARWIGLAIRWIIALITLISIIEMLALNPDFIKITLYILIGCAAIVVTLMLGIGGIRYGRDYLASRLLAKAIKPGDQLLWNDQTMIVNQIEICCTCLTQGSQAIYVANTRLLDNLVLLNQADDLPTDPASDSHK